MKRSTQQLYTERILRVLVFLQKNLDEELSLEEYARVAHFSPYHFHRIFRGMVGESLHEHIRRRRVRRHHPRWPLQPAGTDLYRAAGPMAARTVGIEIQTSPIFGPQAIARKTRSPKRPALARQRLMTMSSMTNWAPSLVNTPLCLPPEEANVTRSTSS